MKNRFKKILSVLLAAAMALGVFALSACDAGGKDIDFDEDGNIIPSDKTTIINFWGWADKFEEEVFNKLVENFNEKYEGVIKVVYTPKPTSGYDDNFVANMIAGPDVAYANERYFKSYAEQGSLYDVTEFFEDSVENYVKTEGKNGLDYADMMPYTVDRYRYNVTTTTSEADDPLYGLAKDLAPTGIYFNTYYFDQAGITVISETEESIEKYNEENPSAKKKIKAFYEEDGKYYFNKSVAMSWQECRELSEFLMEKTDVEYGFFSEWWFNYGYTVGGDCIQYLPSDDPQFNGGYYKFTLADETKNYIVKDDAGPLTVNGTAYKAGEIVSYTDKEHLTAAQKESCNELPSQREAFTEFVRMSSPTTQKVDNVRGVYESVSDFYGADANGDIYGYGITPNPNTIATDGKNGYFTSGKVAMLVSTASVQRQYYNNMQGSSSSKYGYDVAPMLVYKEYSEDGTEVLVHGVEGAHSGSVALVMNANTKNPNAAWLFMEYVASKEGQEIQAEGGFAVPYYKSLAYDEEGAFLNSRYAADNAIVFVEATEYERPGDWWYLKNKKWIDAWAGVLNSDVRGGKMSLTDFYKSAEFIGTQEILYDYTRR